MTLICQNSVFTLRLCTFPVSSKVFLTFLWQVSGAVHLWAVSITVTPLLTEEPAPVRRDTWSAETTAAHALVKPLIGDYKQMLIFSQTGDLHQLSLYSVQIIMTVVCGACVTSCVRIGSEAIAAAVGTVTFWSSTNTAAQIPRVSPFRPLICRLQYIQYILYSAVTDSLQVYLYKAFHNSCFKAASQEIHVSVLQSESILPSVRY